VVAGLPVEKDKRGHIVVDGTMRCPSRPEVWALGDCAVVPAPGGQPYPNLAQHALREARVLARNIAGVLDGRPPQPFVYATLGMMGSLGHSKAFGQLLKVRVRGVLARFVRRTYYLLQMPGWGRRLRIMIDWFFALLFRPDIVKISLDIEAALLLREAAVGAVGQPPNSSQSKMLPEPAAVSSQRNEAFEPHRHLKLHAASRRGQTSWHAQLLNTWWTRWPRRASGASTASSAIASIR
jgi:hypothetical protein